MYSYPSINRFSNKVIAFSGVLFFMPFIPNSRITAIPTSTKNGGMFGVFGGRYVFTTNAAIGRAARPHSLTPTPQGRAEALSQ